MSLYKHSDYFKKWDEGTFKSAEKALNASTIKRIYTSDNDFSYRWALNRSILHVENLSKDDTVANGWLTYFKGDYSDFKPRV